MAYEDVSILRFCVTASNLRVLMLCLSIVCVRACTCARACVHAYVCMRVCVYPQTDNSYTVSVRITRAAFDSSLNPGLFLPVEPCDVSFMNIRWGPLLRLGLSRNVFAGALS